MESEIKQNKIIIALALLLLLANIILYHLVNKSEKDVVPVEVKQPEINNTRGYNFEKGKGYIPYQSDQQVRDLRYNNPEYIFKVPGMIIKSDKDLFEERAEEYIEENYDEILEEYKDR
jgi:hypothetical protein